RATRGGRRLHLRIAIDYSSRQAIARAALDCAQAAPPSLEAWLESFEQRLAEAQAAAKVDLLIRTGGEKRLSDFLLWECAYAELWFTDVMWPDFGAEDLGAALAAFRKRERRFGGLGAALAQAVQNHDARGETDEQLDLGAAD